jgi:hypothetical protein
LSCTSSNLVTAVSPSLTASRIVNGAPALTAAGEVVKSSSYSRVSSGLPATNAILQIGHCPVTAAVISGCMGQYHVIPAGSASDTGSCAAYDAPVDGPPAAVPIRPMVSTAVAA